MCVLRTRPTIFNFSKAQRKKNHSSFEQMKTRLFDCSTTYVRMRTNKYIDGRTCLEKSEQKVCVVVPSGFAGRQVEENVRGFARIRVVGEGRLGAQRDGRQGHDGGQRPNGSDDNGGLLGSGVQLAKWIANGVVTIVRDERQRQNADGNTDLLKTIGKDNKRTFSRYFDFSIL